MLLGAGKRYPLVGAASVHIGYALTRQPARFMANADNTHFLLRKLHSLLGLLPVGAFLVFHLWENSQSRFGADHYNGFVVQQLQRMNYLPLLELFLVALPLLFHALFGFVIWRGGRSNVREYGFLHNRMYWFQRVSGFAIFVFLIYHVGWTRIWTMFDPEVTVNMFAHMEALLSNPVTLGIYGLGMVLSVLHLCNGLWTMGISWGVTTSVRAQQLSFRFCMGLAVILCAMGFHGLAGFLYPTGG